MSIVLKAKTEKNVKKLVEIKTVITNVSSYFSFVLALKTIDARILF